jgi:hypothetical protein
MIARLFIAIVGAAVITAAILLGMSGFATAYKNRGGDKLYLITNILPRPERGRPERPPDAALPPGRTRADFEAGDTRLRVEGLTETGEGLRLTPTPALPTLDPDAVEPE